MELAGSAAIVTGGALGLGAATAAVLAKRGATVFMLDLADAIATAQQIAGVAYLDGALRMAPR
jgi:NAD(P)-dependent dehydrogenase (short-subunit alcohol dehydrogenase family)